MDDDLRLLELLGKALSSHAFRVQRYPASNQALEALQRQPFSALLTDVVRGVEALMAGFLHSPMIVLTGGLSAEEEAGMRAKGADLVLFKPLGIAAIRDNLNGLIAAASQRASVVTVFDVDLQAVVETEQRLIQATIAGDIVVLNELLAEGYAFVSGNIRETKAERLSSVRSGRLRFKEIQVVERSAKHYSDVCVITSLVRITGERDGRDITGEYDAVSIYSQKGGKWRAVGGQLTSSETRAKLA